MVMMMLSLRADEDSGDFVPIYYKYFLNGGTAIWYQGHSLLDLFNIVDLRVPMSNARRDWKDTGGAILVQAPMAAPQITEEQLREAIL